MPGFIGFPELLGLGLVLLLLFGPKRLPELGRSLGGGMREFKDSIVGRHDERTPALPTASVEPVTNAAVAHDETERVAR